MTTHDANQATVFAASNGSHIRLCSLFAKFCEKIRRNCGWVLLSMAVERLNPKLLTASDASIRNAMVATTKKDGPQSKCGCCGGKCRSTPTSLALASYLMTKDEDDTPGHMP